MDQNPKLFVYGSLLRPTGIAEVDTAMSRAGRDLGRASLVGKLYDLGDYPGVIPAQATEPAARSTGSAARFSGSAEPRVWGKLIAMENPELLFSILDAYEGFHALAPELSEFVRAEAEALSAQDGTSHITFVYYYNRSVAGFTPIDSGDYAAYRRFPT